MVVGVKMVWRREIFGRNNGKVTSVM